MLLTDLLSVDDVPPNILSLLTIHEIFTFARCTLHTCISGASWRDLILTFPWKVIVSATQVDVIETQHLCLNLNLSSTTHTSKHPSQPWYQYFVKIAKRDQSFVVVDPGSFELKAGFSGEKEPCCVLATDVVLDKKTSATFGPLTNSHQVWHHVLFTLLQILGVHAHKTRLCIVLRPFDMMSQSNSSSPKPVSLSVLKNIAQVCIESVGVAAVTFRWAPECALLTAKKESGVVLEVGERMSYCVPVSRRRHHDAVASDANDLCNYLSSSSFSMSGIGRGTGKCSYGGDGHLARRGKKLLLPVSTLCGADLTLQMQSELLILQNTNITLQEARHLKEKQCYARARKSKWMPSGADQFLLQGEAQVIPSSGKTVVLAAERFNVPEVLLSPSRIGRLETKSIVDLVTMAMIHVTLSPGQQGPSLFTIGGSMEFRDLPRRLEKELKEIGISECKHLGQYAAWVGASNSGDGSEMDWIRKISTTNSRKMSLQRMKRKLATCTGY